MWAGQRTSVLSILLLACILCPACPARVDNWMQQRPNTTGMHNYSNQNRYQVPTTRSPNHNWNSGQHGNAAWSGRFNQTNTNPNWQFNNTRHVPGQVNQRAGWAAATTPSPNPWMRNNNRTQFAPQNPNWGNPATTPQQGYGSNWGNRPNTTQPNYGNNWGMRPNNSYPSNYGNNWNPGHQNVPNNVGPSKNPAFGWSTRPNNTQFGPIPSSGNWNRPTNQFNSSHSGWNSPTGQFGSNSYYNNPSTGATNYISGYRPDPQNPSYPGVWGGSQFQNNGSRWNTPTTPPPRPYQQQPMSGHDWASQGQRGGDPKTNPWNNINSPINPAIGGTPLAPINNPNNFPMGSGGGGGGSALAPMGGYNSNAGGVALAPLTDPNAASNGVPLAPIGNSGSPWNNPGDLSYAGSPSQPGQNNRQTNTNSNPYANLFN